MATDAKKSFKYIFIPADMSEPIQERQLELEPDKEVEGLLDVLKKHFKSTAPPKSAAQLAAQHAELARQLPAGTTVDDSILAIATGLQMVENIALLPNSKYNGFVGVNMYVDDAGSVRQSPRNMRATEIAHCCGNPIDVRGDAFLARVMDDGDNFARLDLSLSEVSSQAEWVQAAAAAATRRRTAESGAQVLRRIQEEAKQARARKQTPAEVAREEGNAAFKRGEWEAAVGHYSRAVEIDPVAVAARNNRAMALLKLQRWEAALMDCNEVLQQQPANVKALLRAATSESELGRAKEARARLEAALAAQPGNKEAAKLLNELPPIHSTDD